MKMRYTVMVAAFAALLLYSASSALAAGEMTSMTLKGNLIRVSSESHTFVVRGSDDKEVEFTYNDQTEISGASGTIEGLAGKADTSVTVHYKKEGSRNIATKVEVHPEMHTY